MRKFITTLFLLFTVSAFAQTSKYIIQLTNKNNAPYSISAPLAYLSQKAIDRRTKQHIAIDSSDIPVNPFYIQQLLAANNVAYISQNKWLNQVMITATTDAIKTIQQLPFVKKVIAAETPSQQLLKREKQKETINKIDAITLTLTTTEDTIDYGNNYNQVHIHNGEYLHDKNYKGDGITIAILDAGFYHYTTLSAFDSMRSAGHVLGEKDFVSNDNSVTEDDAHGMYCLSTIAANVPGTMVGTAPHASFWLMRTENAASETPAEEYNWVAAAAYADSAGADMISSSLGYYYFDDPADNYSYANFYNNSTIVSQGAAMAAAKGMIVTNSAGNEGNNNWKYIIFPADADSVCAVGAVDNNGAIASFSSYGYPGKVKPNIVSVGSGTVIWGTNNIPVTGSGTSFSNPNINGLIACLWQAFPAYNNMTILNAVYKSSDRYNNPDNRYGFGIPDMKAAYIILKKQQNTELYGNDWLYATPDPFTDKINVKFIAQTEGATTISLLDENGNTIKSITINTQEQEVYDTVFTDLSFLPSGDYIVKYADAVNTKTITLTKQSITLKDWLVAAPVPFTTQLVVYLKAPETGNINIRLINAAGHILESKILSVTINSNYTIPIQSAIPLAKGVYFIQYRGTVKKSIKVLKQ